MAIKESKYLSKLSIDDFLGSWQDHEYNFIRHDNNSLENSFKTKMTFGRGGGRGNLGFRAWGRGRYNY